MAIPQEIRLTELTKGSGCGCKIPPGILGEVLKDRGLPGAYPNLLVGFKSMDDAAAFELPGGDVLLSTVDFFTPVTDDPFEFGQIAAANSISDIYAMGGKPLMATSVLGFPVDKLKPSTVAQIMAGAEQTCQEAGIPLAGGHSIDNPEPFFGLSVNGLVAKAALKKNIGAQVGDDIYITKPIGIGILNTAVKRGHLEPEHKDIYMRVLKQLNREGLWLGEFSEVHAMTDITGFGLLGHLREMAEGSGLTAHLDLQLIPTFEFISQYIQLNCFPDNTFRNWNAHEPHVSALTDMHWFALLNDPQTNGGIMFSADPALAPILIEKAKTEGAMIYRIGSFQRAGAKSVVF